MRGLKLNIGDKVRITNADDFYEKGFIVGAEATIVAYAFGKFYVLEVEGATYSQVADDNDVELIKGAE